MHTAINCARLPPLRVGRIPLRLKTCPLTMQLRLMAAGEGGKTSPCGQTLAPSFQTLPAQNAVLFLDMTRKGKAHRCHPLR